MRLKTIGYALLIIMAIAGIAFAASGDSDFQFRYNTTSTTPITDINYLNGVTSNVQTQLDAGASATLTDTYVYVGNGSNVATGVAVSGDINLANTGVTTIDLADTKLFVGSGAGLATAQTLSGDATIANTGALTLAANSVSVGQFGVINVVTMTMTTGNSGGEVAVEAGSLLLNIELISGFNNDVTLTKGTFNDPTLIINTDQHAGTSIINAIFLRP